MELAENFNPTKVGTTGRPESNLSNPASKSGDQDIRNTFARRSQDIRSTFARRSQDSQNMMGWRNIFQSSQNLHVLLNEHTLGDDQWPEPEYCSQAASQLSRQRN